MAPKAGHHDDPYKKEAKSHHDASAIEQLSEEMIAGAKDLFEEGLFIYCNEEGLVTRLADQHPFNISPIFRRVQGGMGRWTTL